VLLPHAFYTPCPSHPPRLDNSIILGEEYKLWSSSLCNFLRPPVSSSLLSQNSHINLKRIVQGFNDWCCYSQPDGRIDITFYKFVQGLPIQNSIRISVIFLELCSHVEKNGSSEKNWSPTFLLYDTDRKDNDSSKNFFMVTCVFVSTGTCLPSRCLTMIRGMRWQTARLSPKPFIFLKEG
jgi:hypothetical protein